MMTTTTNNRIPRFSNVERAVHWVVAITFSYAVVSGLSLWSRKLYWIAAVLGGGVTVRALHPFIALLFVIAFAWIFRNWAREMRLDADDRTWLANSHKYAMNREEGLPEPGKFNGGQKMLFWTQSAMAMVLLVSGAVLWFPESMPRALRLAAVLVHPLAAIVAIGGFIVHLYMGTAAVPGALRSMIRGYVSPRWAASHHPKWFRGLER